MPLLSGHCRQHCFLNSRNAASHLWLLCVNVKLNKYEFTSDAPERNMGISMIVFVKQIDHKSNVLRQAGISTYVYKKLRFIMTHVLYVILLEICKCLN